MSFCEIYPNSIRSTQESISPTHTNTADGTFWGHKSK